MVSEIWELMHTTDVQWCHKSIGSFDA